MSRSSNSRARRITLAAALVGLPLLAITHHTATAATPSVTLPHLELLKAEPRVNDTVAASPAAIKLWFSESVTAATTSIRVTGPADHVVTLGAVTVDTAAKSPAVAKVTEKLAVGKYTVQWKGIADDGHPSMGTFSFTVRAASPQ